jgi:RNA polymerase sigma-70 factor (ECF subfamily)
MSDWIDDAYKLALAACPGIILGPTDFENFCRACELESRPSRERCEDLFLAAACLAGDPVAVRIFDERFVARVHLFLARFELAETQLDELRQQFRIRMLLDDPPKLARYRGRGSLLAYARVCCLHLALDEFKLRQPPLATEEAIERLVDKAQDPERLLIQTKYQRDVQLAFNEAVQSLSARHRTVLRMNVVDGASIDAIALVYGTHRATAARWLVAIREAIVERIQGRLGAAFNADKVSDIQSLVRFFGDYLHASLERLLPPDRDALGRSEPQRQRDMSGRD